MTFQTRILLVSLLVLSVFGAVFGWFIMSQFQTDLEHQTEQDLLGDARIVREALELVPLADTVEAADRFADKMGQATQNRVTIIRVDGDVIGDSDIDVANISGTENHLDRPEVQGALDTQGSGIGIAKRHSDTLDLNLVYAAVRVQSSDAFDGFVRISTPLHHVTNNQRRIRSSILGAGALGLLLSLLLAVITARIVSRDYRTLSEDIQRLSTEYLEQADLNHSFLRHPHQIAGSIQQLGQELESTMRKLGKHKDRLGSILEGMSEGVIALNATGKITLINPVCCEMLNLPGYEEVRDHPIDQWVTDANLLDSVQLLLHGEHSFLQVEITLDDAPVRVLSTSITPKQDGGCILVLTDVTDVRRLERIRRDFVANVSHELRTPVSVMTACSEALADGAIDDPVAARDFIGSIQRNANRLGNLISDLLALSRIEAGEQPLLVHTVRIHPIIAHCLDSVRAKAHTRHQDITCTIDTTFEVRADANALEQILINFLDNAIKYTPEQGHIELTASSEDGWVEIQVKDNGPGIPEKHRSRLFERFYRVDKGRSKDMGGTGLGLSIVQHLANAMGGGVGMRPNQPHGSCFWIRLERSLPKTGTTRV